MKILRNIKKHQGLLLTSVCAAVLPVFSFAEGPAGLNVAIDTPRAVAGAADDLSIAIDYREDFRALTFGFQATDRLQIALSYPTYDNDDGGSSSGNELSFAYVLVNEGDYVPSIAVGIVGFGSDDRGSGEYVAASKTFGTLSATAGLGWGRYAAAFSGPRGSDEDDVIIATDHIFAGDYEPFVNLVWQTPVDRLTAFAEYSGIASDDADETYAAGLSYEVFPGLSVAGFGNNDGDAGLRLTFLANPTKPFVQDNIGRGPHPYVPLSPARAAAPQANEQQVLAVLKERLEKENIRITRFAMAGNVIDVTPQSPTDVNFARIAGRTARVLSAVAPANITQFRITQDIGVYDTNVIVLDRAQLDQAVGRPDAGERAWQAATLEASPLNRPAALAEVAFEPRLTYGISPSFKADFVTSDNLELTGTLTANARYTFSQQTFVAGALGYRFLNQWEQIDPPAEPGVRSDSRAYTPDEIYLASLTARHRFQLSPEIYSRVSAGLFERAYGGVSAEVLWRSPQQNFALGFEATYVQKRAYEDPFEFEDADATTLIGSLYANVGQNGEFIIVDAGQHLAGDMAVGLTVGRTYTNGWRIAASTSWSEERDNALKFGAELSIPLAWTSPDAGKERTNLSVGGQGGDFGSRVSGTGLLYNEIQSSDRRRIEDAWGEFWN